MRQRGRILAVDPGKVRIGLAICDPDRIIASPLDTRTRESSEADAVYFRELLKEEKFERIVVGLPVHTTGTEGMEAQKARDFGAWLTNVTGVPVVYFDERFTSRFAESALWDAGLTHKKRKARRDRVAAQILLHSYIEAGCPEYDAPKSMDGP